MTFKNEEELMFGVPGSKPPIGVVYGQCSASSSPTVEQMKIMLKKFDEKFPPSDRAVQIRCGLKYFEALVTKTISRPGLPIIEVLRSGLGVHMDPTIPENNAVVEYADGSELWCHISGVSARFPPRTPDEQYKASQKRSEEAQRETPPCLSAAFPNLQAD